MLRVVIDPGVLISALIAPAGTPAALFRAWRDGSFEVVVSPKLLDELGEALSTQKLRRYVSHEGAVAYVSAIQSEAVEIEDPADVAAGLTPDPDDDYLVALARAADALIVSGDKHLTGLPGVMTPRELLDALQSS